MGRGFGGFMLVFCFIRLEIEVYISERLGVEFGLEILLFSLFLFCSWWFWSWRAWFWF